MSDPVAHSRVPALRVRTAREDAVDPQGDYVLHWMTGFRRTEWNFSLQRAMEWARALHRPLLVLEALRCDYPWASDRHHAFIARGMADNASRLERAGVGTYPYLEPKPGAGRGLLERLARRACVVVGDDHPGFFLPRMRQAAERVIRVRTEWVDANGLLPLRATDRVYTRAFDFRRFLQRTLRGHLAALPAADPLRGRRLPPPPAISKGILYRWPPARLEDLREGSSRMADLPIDHAVRPAAQRGGPRAARRALRRFVRERLAQYAGKRNEPEEEVTSGLSPYLHYGHISTHEVVRAVLDREDWTVDRIAPSAAGGARGWWGASVDAEAFLDQLITWRELGFNLAWQRDDGEQYGSLPAWALRTLGAHARDPRDPCYRPDRFEAADTHDPLWNAAQRQLLREGRIHNYLRMLWGKKILEWSSGPAQALETMLDLNNKYALDGRDPNSTSGIFWCLGRYDRPWGPERAIFGTVRYMSSRNTARKVRVRGYLARYAP